MQRSQCLTYFMFAFVCFCFFGRNNYFPNEIPYLIDVYYHGSSQENILQKKEKNNKTPQTPQCFNLLGLTLVGKKCKHSCVQCVGDPGSRIHNCCRYVPRLGLIIFRFRFSPSNLMFRVCLIHTKSARSRYSSKLCKFQDWPSKNGNEGRIYVSFHEPFDQLKKGTHIYGRLCFKDPVGTGERCLDVPGFVTMFSDVSYFIDSSFFQL